VEAAGQRRKTRSAAGSTCRRPATTSSSSRCSHAPRSEIYDPQLVKRLRRIYLRHGEVGLMGWIEPHGTRLPRLLARRRRAGPCCSATRGRRRRRPRRGRARTTSRRRDVDPRGARITVKEWGEAWIEERPHVKRSTDSTDRGRIEEPHHRPARRLQLGQVTPLVVRAGSSSSRRRRARTEDDPQLPRPAAHDDGRRRRREADPVEPVRGHKACPRPKTPRCTSSPARRSRARRCAPERTTGR
jgi:hypothetical protein